MRTMTPEDFTDADKTLISGLHPDTAKKLQDSGVDELLPVQQVTFKLFVSGNEIVVK
jgi:hypothetical protein